MGQFFGATVVDLFCGCGGMSSGLADEGLEILLGVDLNKKYIPSFRENFGASRTLEADIRECDPAQLLTRLGLDRGELDFLVGGPPCQGFSKNTPVSKRTWDSSNNLLVKEFIRLVEGLFPKNIIMENVAEMQRGFGGIFSETVIQKFNELGYEVLDHIFDASDYGLPQKRRRAFFLATREKLNLSIPPKTHFDRSKQEDDLFSVPDKTSVWDAIGDLPPLEHGAVWATSDYPQAPQTEYQKLMRAKSETLTFHKTRKLSEIQYKRLSSLLPGQAHKDLPEDLQVKGGYSGVYGRLTKNMVCPTITRWVFHPGGGRWGHPVDTRTISLREIARLQGFGDHYKFSGSYNDICGQLGNAVPPLLMKTIINCFSS